MSNKVLVTFAALISASLIKSEDYIPGCDEIIRREDVPSELIVDLPLLQDENKAVIRFMKAAGTGFPDAV